jgi:hypothetical protein
MKCNIEPLWEGVNEVDNDSHPFSLEDTVDGDKVDITHDLSNEKSTKVAIDAALSLSSSAKSS